MSRKVYVRAFQTGVGGAAHFMTKQQWKRTAGREQSDVTFRDGLDVWFCYPKAMNRDDAKRAVGYAIDKWLQGKKPSISQLRDSAHNSTDKFKDFPF